MHAHLVWCDEVSPSYLQLLHGAVGKEAYEAMLRRYESPEAFVALLKESGVSHAVILAEHSPLTTGYSWNSAVEDFCAGHPELIPFCTVNPYLDPDPADMVADLCVNHGFKGLKLYPTYNHFYMNEARLYPVYETAQALGIPVTFHTGLAVFRNSRLKYGNPVDIDDVAMDFPDLALVLAHGGRGPWYVEAMAMTRLHKNVYIDISGIPVRKLLGHFPEADRFSHKFLFGTDWPEVAITDSIAKLQSIGLSETALRNILGLNAARLLGIEQGLQGRL
jgi:predicted TIM-barrel fold metal-dependent hydrolase